MTNIRNILLIGKTGNGKSTLGNVLVNKNNNFEEVFEEGEFGVSKTEKNKIKEFWENGIRYRVIDTVGIGDTKLKEREVLYKLADAANEVRGGLYQIFFVTSGRFDEREIFAYNLSRKFIFDEEVVKYTTIVRTGFPNFRKGAKCEEDRIQMIKNNPELAEVIISCKNKIIHVDNPPMNVDDEMELTVNRIKRGNSRSKLLDHLRKNCQTNYKPKNLDGLNARIGNHMTEIEKLQKQLEETKNLSEAQRSQMENEINRLKNKVYNQTKGHFQTIGEGIGEGIDKAVDAVVENCNIL